MERFIRLNWERLVEEAIKRRKQQKLTQEQLAAASGVGRRFIIELESGKPACHLGKSIQVILTLGIEIHLNGKGGEL